MYFNDLTIYDTLVREVFTNVDCKILQYFQSIPELRKILLTKRNCVSAKPKNVNILLIPVSGVFE